MMLNGLAVIAEHAALRVDCEMMHPSLFPIDHMFRLLIDLISKYRRYKLQHRFIDHKKDVILFNSLLNQINTKYILQASFNGKNNRFSLNFFWSVKIFIVV